MKKTMLLVFFMLFLLIPGIAAKQGKIKLLAISEEDGNYVGSTAELYLDIQPGNGRVFLDTSPASKLDTQFSTRFARDMACQYLDEDCSMYDFFYKISADSPIVGGPSGGAATTLLTISLLENIPFDESTAITGTINSGYLIGSVGGLKAKISAAGNENITKVLIPVGESIIKENETEELNLINFGRNISVDVVEVANIDDVLYEFTGKHFEENNKTLEISEMYEDTMKHLSDVLCNRTEALKQEVMNYPAEISVHIVDGDFLDKEKSANNLSESALSAIEEKKYYTAASYCFGANVKYHNLLFKLRNLTRNDIIKLQSETEILINNFEKKLNGYKIETITDLQALMVSKERLDDARSNIEESKRALEENEIEEAIYNLAYGIERTGSSKSWAVFLGKDGKKFMFDVQDLKEACENKISEAQEYYQYVQLLIPGLMEETKEKISNARRDRDKGDYELCLFKASIAKAQANIVLSSMGVEEKQVETLVGNKMDAVKKMIIKQQENEIFPILGYSYYEYSNSLKEKDIYSSLLYSEYALELSNFDIYFKSKESGFKFSLKKEWIIVFICGFIVGFLVSEIIYVLFLRKKKYFRIGFEKRK